MKKLSNTQYNSKQNLFSSTDPNLTKALAKFHHRQQQSANFDNSGRQFNQSQQLQNTRSTTDLLQQQFSQGLQKAIDNFPPIDKNSLNARMPPLQVKKNNYINSKQKNIFNIQDQEIRSSQNQRSINLNNKLSPIKKKSSSKIQEVNEEKEVTPPHIRLSKARLQVANDVNGDIELFHQKLQVRLSKQSFITINNQGTPTNKLSKVDSQYSNEGIDFLKRARMSVQIQEPSDFQRSVQKLMKVSEDKNSRSKSIHKFQQQFLDPRESIRIHMEKMKSIEQRDMNKLRQQSMANPNLFYNMSIHRQSIYSYQGNQLNSRFNQLSSQKSNSNVNLTHGTKSSRDESEESSQEEEEHRRKMSILQHPKKSKTQKKSVMQVENMTAIFSKPIDEREKSDKEKIVLFLRNGVKFLEPIQTSLLFLLSDKLEPVSFKEGEVIITKGDEATCMYILYDGAVDIFSDVDCNQNNKIVHLTSNQVLGEKALENDDKRGASIKAAADCKLLRLKKLYYNSIVQDVIVMQKFQALDFLKTIEILKGWSLIKLQSLNKCLTEKNYKPGDIIYKQGDDSRVFYIIRRGSVLAETIIDIDEYNRYPIGIKTWEIVKKTKRIRYKVYEIGKTQIFGHDELVLNIQRQMTIRALEETNVLYLNKDQFEDFNIIEKADMQKIIERVAPVDVEKIALSIMNIKTNTKIKNDAILNATQINLPSESIRDGGLVKQQAQINKLKPWLEKIRIMQKNNALVKPENQKSSTLEEGSGTVVTLEDSDDDQIQNDELKKVKVLKVIKEKMRVSGNEYLKAQEFKSSELKSRVRLARDLSPSDFY